MNLRRLRHRIRQATSTRLDPRHTRRANKSPLGLGQRVLGGVREPEMCFHVHGEAAVPVVVVDALFYVEEVCDACPAGVGDDGVEAAHCAEGFGDEVLDRGFGGHVCLEEVEAGLLGGGVGAANGGEVIDEGLGAGGV